MKTAGIVAEYNPFHKGHQYHIEETKKQTGADYVIAVMSGDFVQRGAPSFLDKYDRTRAALAGGCDLVLELPVIYSSSSAEFFASGAVTLLDKLGVCHYLSFGSEEGNLESLQFLTDILSREPAEYQSFLQHHLKNGLSFPAARQKALEEYCSFMESVFPCEHIAGYLTGSNNILALEYLKCLRKRNSSMKPYTVMRKNAAYHDNNLYEDISSASAIRNHILHQNTTDELAGSVPLETLNTIQQTIELFHGFPDYDVLTPYLHAALLTSEYLEDYLDWDQELANRTNQLRWTTLSYTEIADALKSRNITHSRIYRALLHLILGIKKDRFFEQWNQNPVPYARILGFRKESSILIREIKENGTLPLITKPSSILKTISKDEQWMWEKDLTAARLYQSIQYTNFGRILPSAYERSPIISDGKMTLASAGGEQQISISGGCQSLI